MHPVTQCPACKHFQIERSEGWYCPAFPGGIPFEIFEGTKKHTKRLPEQTGTVVFEDDHAPA